MRQAGRYLPEYRELRRGVGGFLDLCYTPDLAVEITLQPIRRYGFDAAILFSDILVVPDALGAEVRFVEGEGPQLTPLTGEADLAGLGFASFDAHLAPVYETLRRLRLALPPEVTLIGFSGAPWTLAAYMVEGSGSKEWLAPRRMARRQPELFGQLIDLLTDAIIRYLSAQVEAGAEVLQLFDSWAGVLPEPELRRWCVEPTRRIVSELRATPSADPDHRLSARHRRRLRDVRGRGAGAGHQPRHHGAGGLGGAHAAAASPPCACRAISIRSRCWPTARRCSPRRGGSSPPTAIGRSSSIWVMV